MKNKICLCGGKMEFYLISAKHQMFGKSITVRNVPYYQCKSCNRETYETEQKLDMILRDAYRNGNSEVDYA